MPPGNSIALNVAGLTLDLDGRRILSDLNFTVRVGELMGLIGPNGGGKTTLLRVLLGLVQPSAGKVTWPDREGVAPILGYVPQRVQTDPYFPISTRELVGAARTRRGTFTGSIQPSVDALLERVGLQAHGDTPFVKLSGGQQRRLLLARALLRRPDILLLDEPTSGVDAEGQDQFCRLLENLAAEGLTIVLVSHDLALVTSHAHRIACLNRTLHWHGPAVDLSPEAIRAVYQCELRRYQMRRIPLEPL